MSEAWDVERIKEEYGFDPAALKARYLEQRDKRLRSDGNEQYLEVSGDFAVFAEVPYVPAMAFPFLKLFATDERSASRRSGRAA